MDKAFGIVNFGGRRFWVEGMQEYRPSGAMSFLGRYRTVDFPISNLSNSGIDRIQVYIRRKPRSLVEHIGTGRHYNINSKRGRVHVLFSENGMDHDIYNNDIAAFLENMECIEQINCPYVVIVPSNMVYVQDFNELLQTHIESGADITLLYHSTDDAKEHFLNCNTVNLNKQKGVLSLEMNRGTAKNRSIFMDTYIMKKELFMDLVHRAHKESSMYSLADIVSLVCPELDVRGVAHRGFFATLTDFKSYYDANLSLIDFKTALSLFDPEWPIYTRTNDSCPTQYFEGARVKNSVVSNGCLVEGSIENSVIGRGCVIKKGAVIKNCVIMTDVTVAEGVHLENLVVDKHAHIVHVKEVIAEPGEPAYVRRGDVL